MLKKARSQLLETHIIRNPARNLAEGSLRPGIVTLTNGQAAAKPPSGALRLSSSRVGTAPYRTRQKAFWHREQAWLHVSTPRPARGSAIPGCWITPARLADLGKFARVCDLSIPEAEPEGLHQAASSPALDDLIGLGPATPWDPRLGAKALDGKRPEPHGGVQIILP